jgi:hypothetical protein
MWKKGAEAVTVLDAAAAAAFLLKTSLQGAKHDEGRTIRAPADRSSYEYHPKHLSRSVGIACRCRGGKCASGCAAAKANILFIMGDIGWVQLASYQQGMGLGETPNLDRIANEIARFIPTTLSKVAPRAQRLLHRHGSTRTGISAATAAGRPTFGPALQRSPSSCWTSAGGR